MGVLKLTEVHFRPVDGPQRVGQHLFVVHCFGLFDGQGQPLDGPGVVSALLAEPAVPAEKLGSLARRSVPDGALQDAQTFADPAQGVGVAVEPALDPGQFEDEPGFGHHVVVHQAPGRPIGRGCPHVATAPVAGIAQCLVDGRQFGSAEVGQPPSGGDGSLVELGSLDVGVDRLGPFGGLQ